MRFSSLRRGRAPTGLVTVIAYDVSDDGRRDRVAQVLEDHGNRVQYSVFECVLTLSEFHALRRALEALVDPRQDRLAYYRLRIFGPASVSHFPDTPVDARLTTMIT